MPTHRPHAQPSARRSGGGAARPTAEAWSARRGPSVARPVLSKVSTATAVRAVIGDVRRSTASDLLDHVRSQVLEHFLVGAAVSVLNLLKCSAEMPPY